MSGFAVALLGGPASGAWYESHALAGRMPPEVVEIAVGSKTGPALLDLPEDVLEEGERIERYVLKSVGTICIRGGKGRGCHKVATYVPEGVALGDEQSRGFIHQLAEEAGVIAKLRVVE